MSESSESPASSGTDGRHGTAAITRDPRLLIFPLIFVALTPLLFSGPGTDLDAGSVIRSGRGIIDHFAYTPSRPPGTPVYEFMVGLLARIGGVPLANLGSLVMAGLCIYAFWRIATAEGVDRPGLAALVLLTSPWFLIGATSIEDFVWALALFLLGTWWLRERRSWWLIALLFALAIGCRSTTVLYVVATLALELFHAGPRRRNAVKIGALTAVVATGLFVPAYLSADRTFRFLDNNFETSPLLTQVGRFAAKDLYLFGPVVALCLAGLVPLTVRSCRSFRDDWLVQFALTNLVLSQLLFLRFPWKMGHLLPSVAFTAFLIGRALGRRKAVFAVLLCLQLLYGVVTLDVLAPNHPNAATGGSARLHVTWGPLATDTRCRIAHRHDSLSPIRSIRERAGVCASPFAAEPSP
ncbi:MAG: glycosyltransferase family 39 protein [Actinobacteria bacterium]|nr:glycosyltransferase family 39 protein [Actinomycetota bacterium]